MKRIRKDDVIIVIAGRSKGHIGKVLRIVRGKAIVEGANIIKKHIKPNPQKQIQGGIIAKETFIDLSNVAIYNALLSKADKIGFKFEDKDGKKYKVRYFKSNNELIDTI